METRNPRMRPNPYPTLDANCNSECIRDPNVRAEPTEALEDTGRGFEALNQAAISSYNTQSADGNSSSSSRFERKPFVY